MARPADWSERAKSLTHFICEHKTGRGRGEKGGEQKPGSCRALTVIRRHGQNHGRFRLGKPAR